MCSMLLGASFATMMEKATERGGYVELVERIVYFADGSKCTATKCLDPIAECDHG